MTQNKADDELSILAEISRHEQELANLENELYLLNTRRRLIGQRIADLQYELRQISSNK